MKVIKFIFKIIWIVFLIITSPFWVPIWILVKIGKWMDKRGIKIETRDCK